MSNSQAGAVLRPQERCGAAWRAAKAANVFSAPFQGGSPAFARPAKPFGPATPGDFRPLQAPTGASRIAPTGGLSPAARPGAPGHWTPHQRLVLHISGPASMGPPGMIPGTTPKARTGSSPLPHPRRRPAPRSDVRNAPHETSAIRLDQVFGG